jgi:hypothetical protein
MERRPARRAKAKARPVVDGDASNEDAVAKPKSKANAAGKNKKKARKASDDEDTNETAKVDVLPAKKMKKEEPSREAPSDGEEP